MRYKVTYVRSSNMYTQYFSTLNQSTDFISSLQMKLGVATFSLFEKSGDSWCELIRN